MRADRAVGAETPQRAYRAGHRRHGINGNTCCGQCGALGTAAERVQNLRLKPCLFAHPGVGEHDETVRRGDERSPVLLTIDQPWSEYLRTDTHGISPLHFADALIRADLGLSGLALELNFDRWPGGTLPRDPIELNQLIDRWSMLGLPLMVILSAPTGRNVTAAQAPTSSAGRVTDWQVPKPDWACLEPTPASIDEPGYISPDTIVSLLLSKPSVHAIIWNSIRDSESNSFQSGLWTESVQSKPFLSRLAKLRKTSLH